MRLEIYFQCPGESEIVSAIQTINFTKDDAAPKILRFCLIMLLGTLSKFVLCMNRSEVFSVLKRWYIRIPLNSAAFQCRWFRSL